MPTPESKIFRDQSLVWCDQKNKRFWNWSSSNREFLTGFHKRRTERKKVAQEQIEAKLKQELKEKRRQVTFSPSTILMITIKTDVYSWKKIRKNSEKSCWEVRLREQFWNNHKVGREKRQSLMRKKKVMCCHVKVEFSIIQSFFCSNSVQKQLRYSRIEKMNINITLFVFCALFCYFQRESLSKIWQKFSQKLRNKPDENLIKKISKKLKLHNF